MTGTFSHGRTVTVVDLQIQNILSVENALRIVGADVRVVSRATDVVDADFLLLPGVGSFAEASRRLHGSGFGAAIRAHALEKRSPVLGLCLGMQLLADTSEEHGIHPGLGLIPGTVVRLQECLPDYRVPNIGWRDVQFKDCTSPLVPRTLNGRSFYHVHSYHFQTIDAAHTVGTSQFGQARIASIVQCGSIFGTQFHPEKSQEAGLDLLHALIFGLR